MPDTAASVCERKPFGSEASRWTFRQNTLSHCFGRSTYLRVPIDNSRKERQRNSECKEIEDKGQEHDRLDSCHVERMVPEAEVRGKGICEGREREDQLL